MPTNRTQPSQRLAPANPRDGRFPSSRPRDQLRHVRAPNNRTEVDNTGESPLTRLLPGICLMQLPPVQSLQNEIREEFAHVRHRLAFSADLENSLRARCNDDVGDELPVPLGHSAGRNKAPE